MAVLGFHVSMPSTEGMCCLSLLKNISVIFSQACEKNYPTSSYLNQNYVLTLLTVVWIKRLCSSECGKISWEKRYSSQYIAWHTVGAQQTLEASSMFSVDNAENNAVIPYF